MSAPPLGPRARHGGAPGGARPIRSTTVSTSGDGSRTNLPPTRAGAVVRLAGADLYDWIALRRVNDGGITKMGDHWFDSGRRVPGYVTDALTALCASGLVILAEEDACCMRRATLTPTGTVRYQHLCRARTSPRLPELNSAV